MKCVLLYHVSEILNKFVMSIVTLGLGLLKKKKKLSNEIKLFQIIFKFKIHSHTLAGWRAIGLMPYAKRHKMMGIIMNGKR